MALFPQLVTSTLALWRGTAIRAPDGDQPEQPLQLFDMEGCPHCRLVRETLTELDLDAVIYPCPKGGDRFRNRARELGGRERFPLLVDPEQGEVLYESRRIRRYLWERYGHGRVPGVSSRLPLDKGRVVMATASRLGRGLYAKPARRPERLLELYSFESSPYSREVRELLCELQLPYVIRNCGKSSGSEFVLPAVRDRLGLEYQPRSRNRMELLDRTGRVAVPYLVDPNQGTAMYESETILAHLRDHYQI
ncbi:MULTISPECIES: glutathione S-transferase N-terminal domain-containing protein [Gammaproteobacteria]|jgi:glutathione S-transferase|uniref:Glutathione S-transferase n=1 Tax=Vreelandella halophila TaxID=86177 RepID=A0A9X4YBD9_9GAMM|nr:MULTISPECIES: glutathione S-transferase N-terminal domain-containing protein [Gammaproteobacteria]KAA8982917.1 glutathione S-transferase [Halospina sp. K52047b]MYL25913.1 glutathione S-transferase [Halomonas utahensis]MYL73525.1 glutathione S-transferase [Halomonas sp. 22501_18_FS]